MREGKREIQLKHQEEPVTEDHTRTQREELARKRKLWKKIYIRRICL